MIEPPTTPYSFYVMKHPYAVEVVVLPREALSPNYEKILAQRVLMALVELERQLGEDEVNALPTVGGMQ